MRKRKKTILDEAKAPGEAGNGICEYAAWRFSSHADPNWALIFVAERPITVAPASTDYCQHPTIVEFKELPEVSSLEILKRIKNGAPAGGSDNQQSPLAGICKAGIRA